MTAKYIHELRENTFISTVNHHDVHHCNLCSSINHPHMHRYLYHTHTTTQNSKISQTNTDAEAGKC